MATSFAVDDLLTARLNFREANDVNVAMNVLHYQVTQLTGAPVDIFDALANCAEAIYEHWFDAWAEVASQDVEFESCSVTNEFPPPRSVTVTHSGIGEVDGNVVAPTLPLQNAITILKRTALGSRKGLGRMFITGIPTTSQTGGVLNVDKVADFDLLVAKTPAIVAVAGTGWSAQLTPCLVNGPPDNPVIITHVKQGQLASRVIRAQRRRQPGKGS